MFKQHFDKPDAQQQTGTQQKHKKRVVMNRKMQRALGVLRMPRQELAQFMREQAEQNAMLELADPYEREMPEEPESLPIEEFDPALEWNIPEEDIDKEDSAVDIDLDFAFDDRLSISEWRATRHVDADAQLPEIAQVRSLHEFLEEQLQLADFTETEVAIGEQILGNLDDDGCLRLKLFQIPLKFKEALEKRKLTKPLHAVLQKNLRNGTPLAKTASIRRETAKSWKIMDKTNRQHYTIVQQNGCLDVYQLTLADIAEAVGCPLKQVKSVLRKIQDTFEPTGIAYRDTREALLIQIRTADAPHPLARAIIAYHFTELLHRQFDGIAEALNVDSEEVAAAVEWLGALTPYPGRAYTDTAVRAARAVATSADAAHTVIPDVEIRLLEYGKFARNGVHHRPFYAILSEEDMPSLRMNAHYLELMKDEKQDAETREWLEARYEEAGDILSSIAHRGHSLVRVTEVIFDVQSEFLTKGIHSLKPLTLQMIAKRLGIHESTVSRVTHNKYVQTPYGTYPLRFFFRSKVATRHGGAVSAQHVKHQIQSLIRDEEPTRPLSDQGISDALKAGGILLARRTVQKYRDELGIPAARERRRTS